MIQENVWPWHATSDVACQPDGKQTAGPKCATLGVAHFFVWNKVVSIKSMKREISKILSDMAIFLDMDEVAFKPSAYERAARSIEDQDLDNDDLKAMYKTGGVKSLMEIPGVGRGIAEHIEEFLKKGTFAEYEKYKKKYPVDIEGLTSVSGVGPKMVKTLWQKLKIKNLADLEKAAKVGKIAQLERMGEKTESKILKGLEFLKSTGGRLALGFLLDELRDLEKQIESIPGVDKAVVAGSARRRKETIGDIDILAVSNTPEKVMEEFIKLPFVLDVTAEGPTKTSVRLKWGLNADLRVVPPESFGAALIYFTGSQSHNIKLREIAIKKGLKLNEYGLFKGAKSIAGKTEDEVYKALGLEYIEPEMREDVGEIELALRQAQGKSGDLPKLIGYDDLLGNMQTHSDWSDGESTIEEMAEAAQKIGLEYILMTDHTRGLAMAGGADETKMLKEMAAIDKLNKSSKFQAMGFKILKGAEVNIGKNGELDMDEKVLEKLDVVGAAVHSHFNLSRSEQTNRVIKAMENPNVDIIFHLTGRLINKREAIQVNFDEILKTAKKTGTILEIDAYPDRLDIKDDFVKKCVAAGVKMSIGADAHSPAHYKYLEMGIAQARRGWAKKSDIINAWPVEKMLGFLKNK